jgi:hypothetical protein
VNCDQVREGVAEALMTRTRVDAEVMAHLSGCAACSAEAGDLQQVADLLGELEPADAQPIATDGLFVERLLREAGRRRTARRRRLVVASAAAAVLLVLGAAVGFTRPFRDAASATQDGITASVEIEAEDGASDLIVSVSGVEMGKHCLLRVTSAGGEVETVADWIVLYEGTSHVEADADAPPDALTSVQLVDARDDKVLVAVPLT